MENAVPELSMRLSILTLLVATAVVVASLFAAVLG